MQAMRFILISAFCMTCLYAYDWPIKEDTVQHVLISVMGECRDRRVGGTIVDSIHHFHRGVDIKAPCSTKVYTIEGDTCYKDTISPARGVNIGSFRYYHMVIRDVIDDTSWVGADSLFAKTDGENHVHLQEADTVLKSPGDIDDVKWLNLLRAEGIYPYGDSTPTAYPQIRNGTDGVIFWRQGTNDTISRDTVMDGKIDISVNARDPWTDSLGGSSGAGNMGVYKNYGYIFTKEDTLRLDTLIKFEHHKYDTCSPDQNVEYAYAPGSYTSRHIYFITNNPYDTLNPQDYYWNTKQQEGQLDSVDADSIEVAKFKDGYFWVKAHIYDIKDNSDVESLLVHVDNFNPKVKESRPTPWFAFVPNKQKTIWFKFSEAMDTTTLNTTNITIQSLKADSFNYPIINITYIDSTYELTLEVDSFRLKDTVQVRFSDNVTDLAGKSIESGSKDKGIAYTLTFVVSVKQLTDNDVDDITPDIYHGNIVWVHDSTANGQGEIMLYDFYNNTTTQISPGGGIHNTPHIYENEVAWIGYGWGSTNPVYYYDGSTTQQVAPANRGRYSMEISQGGIIWRAYWSAGGEYDTILVEYYEPVADTIYTIDVFKDWYGRYFGRSDIDGNEIVWEHNDYPADEHEIYYYDGTVQNFSNDVSTDDWTPDISNGQIAWSKGWWGYPTYGSLWFYDGANKRELEFTYEPVQYPYLHNGSIIWFDEPGAFTRRLALYDGRNVTELMQRPEGLSFYSYGSPSIHNNQVAWLRLVHETTQAPFIGYYNVSFYDGEEVIHLTVDTLGTGDSYRTEVHDGFVVFDAWDGNDYEIYLYIGDTLFTPPAIVRNLQGEILSASEKRVRLTWSPSSEPDLAGYNIYRSNTPYQFDTIPYTMVSSAETTFIDTLPIMGMNYYVATAFDNTSNEGGFSNQVEAHIDTTPPAPPLNLAATYDSVNQFVSLIWNTSTNGDLNLYRIYRSEISGTYTTPLDSVFAPDTTFVDSMIFLNKTYYYVVSAVDTNSNESSFSNEDSVFVPGIIFSDFSLATAYNNASRIIRNPSTDELLLAYTSDDSTILCTSSSDEGITWNRGKTIGTGTFPTLTLDSENNPCCLFGRWVGPSGFGSAQLYYTRYIDNHWTAPALLMSVDSVYIGIPEYAIPAPSANIDSQDTIHVTWMSPMGQEYIHRFAIWYGNFYAFDTTPSFNYMQLDTLWTYESTPCPSLAVDNQDIIHVVYETDPGAPFLRYRYREDGAWSEKPKPDTFSQEGSYYPNLEFFGERVHLVWDYRYPDTTVAHELHYRSKSTTGWDTIMNIYEPLPFNVFGEPVNAGGWYTIWADQDIYYSRFDGTTWQEPESVQVTPLLSAHPTAMFRQDLDDTCLYIAWTEGDSAPYTIQFEKITVPSVPRSYANLGQPIQSPYCFERDGYWIFGDKPYESVDYDNDSLVYKFTDLDPAKEYRLDLAYYFEPNPPRYSPPPLSSPFKGEGIIDCTSLIKGRGMSGKVSATNHCSDLKCPTDEIISLPAADRSDHAGDESEKGVGRLIQALVIDGVRLDSAFIVPHKLVRISIWLPNELYADGEIIIEIEKIKGKVVVCGEIALYEFDGREKCSTANTRGGPQSNETMHVSSLFFQGLYPNPAKGDLKVKFNSPDEREVTVKLYDVTGRLINEIFNGKLKVGTNEIPIRYKKLAAGVYFIRIVADPVVGEVGKDIITEKVVMLK